MPELPYLTTDLPGIGGRIKERVEDFRVDELPAMTPTGRGRYAHFRVIKKGLPTPIAVSRLARFLGVSPGDIGVAGMKDSQAVTSQWMSVDSSCTGRLERFRDAQIEIDEIIWHSERLRAGQLVGNRFAIRIRGVGRKQLADAHQVLDVLKRRGAPNFFGPQRFGNRGDTGRLGAAMVRGDLAEFVALFLGKPLDGEEPDIQAARKAFDLGQYDRAIGQWPRHFVDQRKALAAYKRRQNPVSALAAIDPRMKRLFVSAFQSEIFNLVLTRRLATFDQLAAGDLAMEAGSNQFFLVEDPAPLAPRVAKLVISPTGPIAGNRCPLAQGEMGALEQETLAAFEVTAESFQRVDRLEVRGSRRPLRFAMVEPRLSAGKDRFGEFIELAFTAPSGCYATIPLREIMKVDVEPGA